MTRAKLAAEGAEAAFAAGVDDPCGDPADLTGQAPAVGAAPASFEIAMTELESLVERMEGGRLALEESLAAYQRGVVLVKYCRDTLGQVSQRVRILEADLLQPFEAVADDRDA